MNLQTLLVYSPFLALLYVLYALIQALRGKQQGVIAALLAFIAMGTSLAAYVLTSDAIAKAQLVEYMVINAAVVFIASILMLLIERRRPDRDLNRSYGMLGIGLSILLALGIFITPLISRALPGGNLAGATANNRAGNSTLQTVSALTPGAAVNGTAQADTPSQVAQVLSTQTGLSVADLTTQLTGGSTTIAQLVSAKNGDLNAVTTAIASALDQMNASGGQSAQFISRLGTDTTAVATQIVQGQLQGRAAQFIIPILLTGTLPQFGGGGGNGTGGGFGGGNGGGATPAQNGGAPQATVQPAPASATEAGGASQVAQVLSAQTGLSAADLTTQLSGGSTIAQLVTAHNGDMNAVTTAIASALDQLIAAGGRGAQVISTLGTDTTAIANQVAQGQLQGRAQQFVVSLLLPVGTTPPQNGSAPNNPPQATVQPTVAAPVSTPQAGATETVGQTQVAQVLSAQTGLSVADLTTQLTGGSTTIAQLVSANNGDLNAVTTAIASALDQMNTSGGQSAQFISRLGTDTTAVATQIVQGQLQGRAAQFIIPILLTGTLPQFGGGGNGGGGFGGGGFGGGNGAATQDQSGGAANNVPQATATPTVDIATNTPTTERPTPIVFPTATPTPLQTEASVAATSQASASACNLITNYDLNMRDKPNKDTGSVLISIPLGTSISADTRTSDGWYSVTYGGHSGWVDGTYASPSAGCASLPTSTP